MATPESNELDIFQLAYREAYYDAQPAVDFLNGMAIILIKYLGDYANYKLMKYDMYRKFRRIMAS